MEKLVLLRHGESIWNRENRFTGWIDVDLSDKGLEEASKAGILLKGAGYTFDLCFTSVLRRAIRTLWTVLDCMDLMWVPVQCDWRLNERHYGALEGLNKSETAAKYGADQVRLWRRSYDMSPPPLMRNDPRYPSGDPRYRHLNGLQIPFAESLKDTEERVIPCWREKIAPQVRAGSKVLITAHGNSLRALVKYLDSLSSEEVVKLEIPTGVPLVYEFDNDMRATGHYYL